ncbi:hypothetical protein KUCAC02_032471 [Chaenocephalus aceratus]|nr:hypothetical protein KUCAC02_032471 [Chaenocephalus aceratus]
MADRKQSPEEELAALAGEDSEADSLVDSASDDEDLLQPERRRCSHRDDSSSERAAQRGGVSPTARSGTLMLQLDGFPTGDAVKADRSAGRLTGSMMELQTLQEALKVEIQIHQVSLCPVASRCRCALWPAGVAVPCVFPDCLSFFFCRKLVSQMKQDPQNADLKKQLHELQANITALSEKQKKVVEQLRKELMKQEPEGKLYLQTPAGGDVKQSPQQTLMVTPLLTTKTLPLVLKALPPTVAVVTAAITKPDLQSVPINLQVAGKLTNQSAEPVRLVTKNAMVMQATTTSAQPIKVPQFVPPPRLTPRPTYQPQVRPKPPPPSYTNVHIAPAPPPPMMAAPQLLQRPLMLATKLSSSSLPSAAPIHQVRILNVSRAERAATR